MVKGTFTQKMILIGFLLSDESQIENSADYVDFEAILAEAFITIPQRRDKNRLTTLLLSWIEVHGWCINHEKLKKNLEKLPHEEVLESYASLAGAFATFRKLKGWNYLLTFASTNGVKDLSESSTIAMRGLEPWALNAGYRLAKDTLKTDLRWVMSRSQLSEFRPEYKNRLIVGPNWRADVLSVVEKGVNRPADVQKIILISYEPAHRILKDLKDAGKFRLMSNSI